MVVYATVHSLRQQVLLGTPDSCYVCYQVTEPTLQQIDCVLFFVVPDPFFLPEQSSGSQGPHLLMFQIQSQLVSTKHASPEYLVSLPPEVLKEPLWPLAVHLAQHRLLGIKAPSHTFKTIIWVIVKLANDICPQHWEIQSAILSSSKHAGETCIAIPGCLDVSNSIFHHAWLFFAQLVRAIWGRARQQVQLWLADNHRLQRTNPIPATESRPSLTISHSEWKVFIVVLYSGGISGSQEAWRVCIT